MARRIEVEIVGNSAPLERSLSRSSREVSKFGREMERSFRGTLAASGVFKSLGRQVAFASGAFIGAAGFVGAAKAAIEGAANLEAQIARTDAAFGSSSKTILSWSKTTASSLGLARDQSL